jgi:hypothetical protein
MGTREKRNLPRESQGDTELAQPSHPSGSCESEEKGRQNGLASAERRWLKAIQSATLRFEESARACKSEMKFRGRSPVQYGHGSSLL